MKHFKLFSVTLAFLCLSISIAKADQVITLNTETYSAAITDANVTIHTTGICYLSGRIYNSVVSLTKTGSGTLILTNSSNEVGGSVTISEGTLIIGNGISGDLKAPVIVNNSQLFFLPASEMTFAGNIVGSGSVYVQGENKKLILTGTLTYTGPTYCEENTLQIGNGAGTSTNLNSTSEVNMSWGTLRICSYGLTEITAPIRGDVVNVVIALPSSSIVFFSTDQTYNGKTTVESGILSLGRGTPAGSVNTDIEVKSGCYLNFNRTTPYTYSKIISGGGFVDLVNGSLILNGNNTCNGRLNINAGSIEFYRWPGNVHFNDGRFVVKGNVYIDGNFSQYVDFDTSTSIEMNLSSPSTIVVAGTYSNTSGDAVPINVSAIGSASSYTLITAAGGGLAGKPFTLNGVAGTLSATNNALTLLPPGPPAAPTGLTATPGVGQIALAWTTPPNGGSPIFGYQVSCVAGAAAPDWKDIASNASTTSYTVTGLTGGTSYTLQVRARNSHGVGASSATVTATPLPAGTVPAAPGSFTAIPQDGQVTLTWTTPSDGGSPITGYKLSFGLSGSYRQRFDAIPSSKASTVTYTVTRLTNGASYTFELRAVNSIGDGAIAGPITAIPAAAATVPDAPTNLSATPGNGQITLAWTTPSDGGSVITGYQVSCVAGAAPADWKDIASNASTTSYTVTGLTNGTGYTLQVRAKNAVGIGANSKTVMAIPAAAATAPAAPTGLSATPGNGQITLAWTTPSDGGSAITGYQVSCVAGAAPADWKDIASNASTTSYTFTGLTNGTGYTLQVRAKNAIGTGANSTTVTATPAAAATVPAAPTGLSATPGNGQITLTWTTPSDGGSAITGYQVSCVAGAAPADWKDITSNASTVSYTVTGLTNGTSYTLQVRAKNAIGTGANSTTVTATPAATATAPAAPTGLSATPGNGQITLAWTTPSDGGSAITGYQVSCVAGAAPADWKDIASNASTVSYTVTGLTNGTSYTLQVRAKNAIGTGANSATVTATPAAAATAPGAPTGLSATPGNGQITLAWTTPSDGGSAITGYQVSCVAGAAPADWKDIASNASTVSYTVTGLTNGTSYTLQVRAKNAVGTGANSTTVTATPTTVAIAPAAPTGLFAMPGNGQITLSWTTPSNGGSAITGYQVSCVAGDAPDDWKDIASNASTVSYTVTGLTNDTSYTLQVRAKNAIGIGANSTTVTATPTTAVTPPTPPTAPTPPAAPTGFSATPGNGQVTLAWTTPSDGGSPILGYQISYGRTDSYSTRSWAPISNSDAWTTTYTVTGLSNGTSYTFEIRAINDTGEGAISSTATTTPTNDVGTEAITGAVVKAYPNPFTDALHITGADGSRLRLISMSGMTVHTREITSSDETLYLNRLPAGVYFLLLENVGTVQTIKVVKQ